MVIKPNSRGLEYCKQNLDISTYEEIERRLKYIPLKLRVIFLAKLGLDERGMFYSSFYNLDRRFNIKNSEELFKTAEKAMMLCKNFDLLSKDDLETKTFRQLAGYAELARDIVSNVGAFRKKIPKSVINCEKLMQTMQKVLSSDELYFCKLYYGLEGRPKRSMPIGKVDSHRKKRDVQSRIKKKLKAHINVFMEWDIPEISDKSIPYSEEMKKRV